MSKTKIRPLHDRILVRRVEEERTSVGGIVIPDSAAEKPDQGDVLAVGNGKIKMTAAFTSWMLKSATVCCSASMPVARSKLTVKNCWSCVKTT